MTRATRSMACVARVVRGSSSISRVVLGRHGAHHGDPTGCGGGPSSRFSGTAPGMTMRYQHLAPGYLRDAMAILEMAGDDAHDATPIAD